MVQDEAGIAVHKQVLLSGEEEKQVNTSNCNNGTATTYRTTDCESAAEKSSEKCEMCVSRRTT